MWTPKQRTASRAANCRKCWAILSSHPTRILRVIKSRSYVQSYLTEEEIIGRSSGEASLGGQVERVLCVKCLMRSSYFSGAAKAVVPDRPLERLGPRFCLWSPPRCGFLKLNLLRAPLEIPRCFTDRGETETRQRAPEIRGPGPRHTPQIGQGCDVAYPPQATGSQDELCFNIHRSVRYCQRLVCPSLSSKTPCRTPEVRT